MDKPSLPVRVFKRVDTLLILLVAIMAFLLIRLYGGDLNSSPFVKEAYTPYPAQQGTASQLAPPDDLVSMPEKGPKVRFCMLNAHNYFVPEDARRSRYELKFKDLESREAVAAVIAAAEPDIVGLVEIGGPAALDDLATRLATRGLDYPHRKVLVRAGEDRALAVLSRYPIAQNQSVVDCPLVAGEERCMLRGILDVTVRTDDGRYFRIMGAHLKSRYAEDEGEADSQRAMEARAIARHLQAAQQLQPAMPILVYGDWNDGPHDPSLGILTQGLTEASALTRLRPRDSRGEVWTFYYPQKAEYTAFDQIYVNTVMRQRRSKGNCRMGIIDCEEMSEASDHRGIWCDLR